VRAVDVSRQISKGELLTQTGYRDFVADARCTALTPTLSRAAGEVATKGASRRIVRANIDVTGAAFRNLVKVAHLNTHFGSSLMQTIEQATQMILTKLAPHTPVFRAAGDFCIEFWVVHKNGAWSERYVQLQEDRYSDPRRLSEILKFLVADASGWRVV
jgi:hypothetical protein